jgi:hypothetical protein
MRMAQSALGARLLREAGFTYDERLDVWFNLDAGRAISGVSLRENSDEWLTAWIASGGRTPERRNKDTGRLKLGHRGRN